MPFSIKATANDGAMIALYLQPEQALALNELSTAAFGVNAQQAADLHCTLVYLAEDAATIEDKRVALQEALGKFADSTTPFIGKINGYGCFKAEVDRIPDSAGSAQDVIYAGLDAPALPALRQQLIELVKSVGIMPVENHGFTPHITLAYVEPGSIVLDIPLEPIDVAFNAVNLTWLNERTEFQLVANPVAAQADNPDQPAGQPSLFTEQELIAAAARAKSLPDDVLATLVQLGMDTNNRRESNTGFDDGELLDFVSSAARQLGYIDSDNPLDESRVNDMIAQCQAKSARHIDMLMANGTAIKSLGNGRVGGYLVVFSDGSHKDLEGDWFDKDCEFQLDWYSERPMLYHHALDATLKTMKIGTIDTIRRDEVGLWAEAQLNLADKYVQYVQKMIEMGKLGWSSQSPPYLVVKEPNGRIKRWIVIEGSATPTPAQPQLTKITTLKAYLEELEGLAAKAATLEDVLKGDLNVSEVSQDVSSTEQSKETDMNEQMMRAVVQAVVDALGMQMSEEELTQLVQRAMPAYDKYKQDAVAAQSTDAALTDQQMSQKAIHAPEFLQAIAALVREANGQNMADVSAAVKSTIAAAPPISKTTPFQTPGVKGAIHVSGGLDRRFDHLKAHEMAFGHMMLKGMGKGTSEDYQKAMAYKTAQLVERGDVAANDLAVKADFTFLKANEVMQSTLAGYGDEYVGTYFNTRLWEVVRQETPIYQEFLKRGMDEQEIPAGYEKDEIPLEGADPDWYVAAGGADEDTSSGMITPTHSSSKFATGQKEVTVAKLSTTLNYQKELEEDSIVGIVKEASRKIETSGREQMEMIFINGDVVLTATTNINFINGTPAAAPSRPSYTLLDGLLKLALVTNTANSRDAGGTLTEADYLALLPLLGLNGKLASDLEKCLFLVDNLTYFASLNIPSVKTKDVNSAATIEGGVLARMFGIDIFRSGQIQLANSAGKVPLTAGASTGTLGRIALARPDQWASRWKRKMEMFTTYYPRSDTTQVVAHLRWGIAYRDSEAVAVSYDVPVTIS
jgi:2'-5' RNA ligase